MARYENGQLHIHGGIISLNGKEMVRKDLNGSTDQAEILGHQLAEEVLQSGGEAILQSIRKFQN
jgi:hydroxymethylbilane synthase